jgi:hypothetical protein
MYHFLIFSVSLLFCFQIQAQWNVYDSGKEYQVLVSTAQGQTAIYKNVPCEVKLVSLKNKTLKLTSTNATVTPNAEPGSYSIQTSDENAVIQIYSAKKSKMKLLKEIQIRTVDVPALDELTISGNTLSVGYGYYTQYASGYDPSTYDQQVFSNSYAVESWSFSCPAASKYLNGSGNQLSQEVISFLRYLPEGVSYEIIAYHNGPIKPGDYQATVMQAFTSQNIEMPGAKYVVLNNTPANKAFFDPNDPNSLIGLINNNFSVQPDLAKGIFTEFKTTTKDGDFDGPVSDGMDIQTLKELNSKPNLKYIEEIDPQKNPKMILVNGEILPVFVKKGFDIAVKSYVNWDSMLEQLDPISETTDPSQAELIPGTNDPFGVEYRTRTIKFAYTTDSIQQIIIRYDSVLNIASGVIENQPTRISLARKFGKNELSDIVFSIKVKDLLTFSGYAPTIHVKNDKSNTSLFDLENPKSLLGYLNSKKVRESGIASFPVLNQRGAEEFGDDCTSGKIDEKLIETETEIGQVFEKYIVDPSMGYAVNVYYKKGSATDIKIFNQFNQFEADILDEKNETTKVEEAELDPNGLPYQVSCRIDYLKNSQYRGLTDLFIKRKYLYDPIYGVYVAKPISIGYAQQMPGQSKPTLIMKVELNSDPKLMSMLPKMQSQLFLSQPWALSLLQNDIEYAGETIDASDIPALQKKFQFRKKMVSIMGDMEVTNEPHF